MLIVLGVPVLLLGFVCPSRWLLAKCARLWARAMLAIAGTRLTVAGRRHTESNEPRFYMANHQSALDIPIVVVVTGGDALFFSKSSLFRIPIFGWILSRYGFVPIHRSPKRATVKALDRLVERLRRQPRSVAVFPEGTRSRDGQLSPFRQGTMKIATRAGLTVVPITIDGSVWVNHRDEFRLRPGPVRVTFEEPISARKVAAMTPIELNDRVRGAIERRLGKSSRAAHRVDSPTAREGTQGEKRRDTAAATHP